MRVIFRGSAKKLAIVIVLTQHFQELTLKIGRIPRVDLEMVQILLEWALTLFSNRT